jgi:hypothetical protein
MTPRFVPVLVGIAGFVVTLMFCARQEGFWQRSPQPPVAALQLAPRLIPAPLQAVSLDLTPIQTEQSGPAATPAPPLNGDRATVADEDAAPPADDREVSEQRRDEVRGARTR